MSTQGECQWQYLDLIRTVMNNCRGTFPVVRYAYTTIPTYPSGQIGFIMCSKDVNVDISGTMLHLWDYCGALFCVVHINDNTT
jgi:spermidine synthase